MTKKNNKDLELDVEFYQQYLNDKNINEAYKKELIETVWSLIQHFVKCGYRVHPMQSSHNNCEQFEKSASGVPQDDSDQVESVNKDLVEAFIVSQNTEEQPNKKGDKNDA